MQCKKRLAAQFSFLLIDSWNTFPFLLQDRCSDRSVDIYYSVQNWYVVEALAKSVENVSKTELREERSLDRKWRINQSAEIDFLKIFKFLKSSSSSLCNALHILNIWIMNFFDKFTYLLKFYDWTRRDNKFSAANPKLAWDLWNYNKTLGKTQQILETMKCISQIMSYICMEKIIFPIFSKYFSSTSWLVTVTHCLGNGQAGTGHV